MAPTLEDCEAAEQLAVETDARRLGVHTAVVAAVSVLLVVVNITLATGFPWSVFPAGGMAVGVFFPSFFGVRHAVAELQRHQDKV